MRFEMSVAEVGVTHDSGIANDEVISGTGLIELLLDREPGRFVEPNLNLGDLVARFLRLGSQFELDRLSFIERWLTEQRHQVGLLKFLPLRTETEQKVLIHLGAVLCEVVFLNPFQTGVVDVEAVAGAQNGARIRRLHFQKHFIVVHQDGTGFGGAIVDHDGDFGALDIGREAVKTLCGAIEFPEGAIQRSRTVVLTSRWPRPEARDGNNGDKRNSQYEAFYDQIMSLGEWSAR